MTAVFDCHLQEQFITLRLSFILDSLVVYTGYKNAIDSQIVLRSGEEKGAPRGVEGYYPKAIMPLLLAAPSNTTLSGARMGSHFSKDYLPFSNMINSEPGIA